MAQVQAASIGVEAIGSVAGEVWRALSGGQKVSLAVLEKKAGAPKPLVHMALGWLAREGKIGFAQKGRSVDVWLQ